MRQVKEHEKRLIVKSAGQFLSYDEDFEADKIYDAYCKLIELRDNDKSDELASDYVPVWEQFENETVFTLLSIISNAMKEVTSYNPIDHLDWEALREQKEVLQSIKHSLSVEETDAIEGLLNLIDSIQDYGLDVLGYDEDIVLNLPKELIGYQVVNENNDIHPKMANTFSVYSHSDAVEMQSDSNNKTNWKIVPIYEGDIENPEFMFEGYPKN
jgi:hypothetical protein